MLRLEKALALAGYVAVSVAFFGWRLLPDPGRVVFGEDNAPIYIWSFAWWEHAIATFTNPFVTDQLYVPVGVNIMWTPSAPGLALAFSPLTALVGPIASYNVAGVLLPALSAWTAYLLCRYLTGSTWASLIGGYLFGFSTASLRQIEPGHINLSAIFLFPLVALVVMRFLRQDLTGRGLAWRLGALLTFQLTISTEFAFMVTVALASSLILAFWLVREVRPRIRSAVVPIVAGYGLAAVFAAPFVYYLLSDFHSATVVTDIKLWGTDLLAPFVPSYVHALGGNDLPGLQGHVSSRLAYLGLPTVAILAVYAFRAYRTPGGRFLLVAFAAAFVVTLGATLQVYGHTLFTLPWWTAAAHVPGLSDALPFRFAVLESLAAAAVIVALWTAGSKGRVFRHPYVLPTLAVAALIPAVFDPSNFEPRHSERSAFFTEGAYKSCIGPGETVAMYPVGGGALVAQAEAGFRFKLAQGGIQPFAKEGKPLNRFDEDPIVWDLVYVDWAKPTMDRLLAFAGAHGVDRVVAIERYGYPTARQMKSFGPTQRIAGAIVAPPCGSPSLATHDLSGPISRWEVDPQPFDTRPKIGWCLGTNYIGIPIGLDPPHSQANRVAIYVDGVGLTCTPPPPGYTRHGFASPDLNVHGGTYPYYTQ